MEDVMNNNCQHLSPKTGKWEPCVGPENCDYRKQGLDVPHAYSQSEREAIDAERAGVGDGLQGSERDADSQKVFSTLEKMTEKIDPDYINDVQYLDGVREKYGVLKPEDDKYRFMDDTPFIPGARIRISSEDYDENYREGMIIGLSKENPNFFEVVNEKTGNMFWARARNHKEHKQSVEVLDYPNDYSAYMNLRLSVFRSEVGKETGKLARNSEVIGKNIIEGSGIDPSGFKVSTMSDGSTRITGHFNEFGTGFQFDLNRQGDIEHYSAPDERSEKIRDYLTSHDSAETRKLVKETYDASRRKDVLIRERYSQIPIGDIDSISFASAEERQKRFDTGMSKIKDSRKKYQKEVRGNLSSELKKYYGEDTTRIRIGKDKEGIWVKYEDRSVPGVVRTGSGRIKDPRVNGKEGDYFEPRNDKNTGPYGGLRSFINNMSPADVEELYDVHREIDEDKMRSMFKSF